MKKPLRVLLVEDSEDDALLIARELRKGGYEPAVSRVESAPEMAAALEAQIWDVIISDYRMPQFSGVTALKMTQERKLDVPFILVSGAIGEDIAVEAMKAGVHDYLLKGNLARLSPAVERELKDAEERMQRRWAEATLRESEERFRLLVDGTPDYAILMLDPIGRVTSWNTGAKRINGYEADEIVGQHFARFFPAEAIARGWPARELEITKSEGRFEDRGWRMRKDGSRFWANVVITALRDEAGNLKGFSKITRDLTEQKRIEDEIRTLNQELESRVIERTTELREAVESLRGEIKERRRLEREILEISEREKARAGQDLHDGLCQTLTGIALIAKLLQQNLEDEKLSLPRASEDARKIVELIRQANKEARNLALGMYPVNIEEYGLAGALEKLAAEMGQRFRIKCKFKCAEPIQLEDKHVATHLYRITQEAMSNAYKHGMAYVVSIKLAEEGDRIILKIEDNGKGKLKDLKSTGMGLKTMSYRARAIGGSLEIRERARGGLAVICEFRNQKRAEA